MNETPGDRTPEQVMAEALRRWSGVDTEGTNDAAFVIAALYRLGFAVVPVEPTDKMVEAMTGASTEGFWPAAVYRAAVAANEEGE
jgi:hypothetical protein